MEMLNSSERAELQPSTGTRQYRVFSRPMGLRSGIDLDKALTFAAELQDAEVVRRLESCRGSSS